MATRLELRQEAQIRLQDWEQSDWDPAELDNLANKGQDIFTKETKYLQAVNVQNIISTQGLYAIAPTAGYRIGPILGADFYNGNVDRPLVLLTFEKLRSMDPNWRNRSNAVPIWYVPNLNPVTADTTANDSIWLYETPSAAYTNGLRVYYTVFTDGQMTADATAMALPERVGYEALIGYICGTALRRKAVEVAQSAPEVAQAMMAASTDHLAIWTTDMSKASIEVLRGFKAGQFSRRSRFV